MGKELNNNSIEDFDIYSSTKWLLSDDVPHKGLLMALGLVIIGIGLFFFTTLPVIFLWSVGALEDPLSGFLTGLIPFLVIFIGYSIYVSKGNTIRHLRITGRLLFIPKDRYGNIRRPTDRGYYSVDRIKDIEIGTDRWGTNVFRLTILDTHDVERTFEMGYSYDVPEYEYDFIGFVEALERILPNGPQPTVDEFLKKCNGAIPSDHIDADQYTRHEENSLWAFPFLYFLYFIVPLLMVWFISTTVFNYFLDLMLFGPMLLCQIAGCILLIDMILEARIPFLDVLLTDLRVSDDGIHVPMPFIPGLMISRRKIVPIDEIKELRTHLILNPLSRLWMTVMGDGSAFLASEKSIEQLMNDPRFERRGRRLVNTAFTGKNTRPIANFRWTLIRLLLLFPPLLTIALAIREITLGL